MEFKRAFDISRTVSNGWLAFKRAPVPLFIGAFILQMTESGGGGGNSNFSGSDFDFDNSGSGADGWDQYALPVWDQLGQWIDGGGGNPFGALLGQAGGFDWEDPAIWTAIGVGVACVLILGIVFFVLRCWIHPGFLMLNQKVLEEGITDFGPLFGGGGHLLNMALWKILSAIIGMGTLFFALAPGGALLFMGFKQEVEAMMWTGGALMFLIAFPVMIYVGLGLVFGNRVVALEGVGAMEALERSWELARGNRFGLFIYQLVLALVMLVSVFAGLMLCCVGMLVTVPVARGVIELAWTEAYLAFTRPEHEVASWWIYQAGTPILGLDPTGPASAFD